MNDVPQKDDSSLVTSGQGQIDWPRLISYLVAILLAGVVLYARTVDYGLVHCDDHVFVLEQRAYNSNPVSLWTSFRRAIGNSYYRPLLQWSFIFDQQMWGGGPRAFRITNLLLHLTASILVFLTLLRLGYRHLPSLLVTLLFVVHPVLSPVATWISARNDSLLAILILVSFNLLCLARVSGKVYQKTYFGLHLLAYFLALLVKETAIILPLIGAVYLVLVCKEPWRKKNNYYLAGGWLGVTLIWLMMRGQALAGTESKDLFGFWAFLENSCSVLPLFGKLFVPIKLHSLSCFEWTSFSCGVVAAIVLGITIYRVGKSDSGKKMGFGLLWFALFLLPSMLIKLEGSGDFFDYTESRSYLPMIGMLIVILELLRYYKIDFHKKIPITIAVIILLLFACRTFFYQTVFENRKSFWANANNLYPHKARTFLDLAKAYYAERDYDRALQLLIKGSELNPDNVSFFVDLSAVEMARKNWPEAAAYGARAVQLSPNNPLANFNFGRSLLEVKRPKLAVDYLKRAIELTTPPPKWFVELGMAYLKAGDYRNAAVACKQAIERNPRLVFAHLNLGVAYFRLKSYHSAEQQWLNCLKVDPNFKQAYLNLIKLYTIQNDQRKLQEMIIRFRRSTPIPSM